ncbi:hypothetical protein GCM10011490_25260 [Pseudoclavibacter endophyticus]|uniref:Chromosome partition protein Smc n=1 Tax=Pseudoclavibacter endophyticus TaxID=1778590 RepID=A0A6H9WMT1_9MICO|nr:AAA family ATPase [Pseudoclavibacter endophyticus]KAB1647856.1 AAA family ATPase [Pseudoclavibacter endophyticus]GGA73364.1 hypothetical protein GCM10011490_25260 [Pseudoclavibacter endophyticus]
MHLKSLTLKGFKSFANPTSLVFEPGVTCVVGPNGSGKSNVVDALAWVMGEQGAKSLRGGKMEDVIFAGTSTRGPLGRAEVTLTIDNVDGTLPIDYSEVTIRRTLFRNGGSEYAINGEQARLLDVQELLSDTGLGREMHVIVGQGRLDNVLHATPEERRGFIEEAAGILKHRRRKEKTVRKLEGMEANLTRLNDLATEVRRQLKPLGRQAEVARRAHGIAAIARDARARLFADDVVRLRRAVREATATEQERGTERAVLNEKLQRALARAERIIAEQRGDEVDRARKTRFELESVLERMRNTQMLASQRRGLVAQRLEAPEFTPSVTREEVESAVNEARRLASEVGDAETAWAEAQEATRVARQALDEVDRQVAATSALIAQHEVRQTELKGRAESAAGRLASVRGEVLRQTNARDAARSRLDAAATTLDELLATSARGEADSSELDETYREAAEAVTRAEGDLEEARDRLHSLERERDALEARRAALALAAKTPDGTDALLAAGLVGVRGTVTDHVRVAEGYEAAVAAALGSLADAVLVDGAAAGRGVLERARGEKLGRVELVVDVDVDVDADVDTEDRGFDVTPGSGATRASEVVLSAPAAVRAMLRDVVVVDDLAVAGALLDGPSGAALARAGATVVTREADVLAPRVYRGGSGGVGQSRLELSADLERTVARLDEVTRARDAASIEVAELRGALSAAKQASTGALDALRAFDADLASQREQLNRAQARSDAAVAEHARAVTALETASAGVGEAEERAAAAKRAYEEHLATPRPTLEAGVRDEAAARVERARDAEVEARLAVETRKERVRGERARAERLATQLEADREAADRAAREAVLRRRELARIEAALAVMPTVLASLEGAVDEARTAQHDAERDREAKNEELAALRAEESTLRQRLGEITEDVHALELGIYEKKLQLKNVLDRAASELSMGEQVLVAEYGPDRLVPRDDEALRSHAERAAALAAEAAALREDDDASAEPGLSAPESQDSPAQPGALGPGSSPGSADWGASVRERREAELEGGLGDLHASDEERAAAEATTGPTEPSPHDQDGHPAHGGHEGEGGRPANDEPEDGVPFDRAAQERRLAAAEKQLAQLGRVNPLALEEFAALEQRSAFLTEQLDDLQRTRTDLLQIVDDIDERMKTVFEAAFDDTREAFHEVFPVLFPGGTGDLSLTAPDDLLRTGIEVSVRPAGKKIERLTLLSGGERSLAAVALLIAIFKARPSPFYIMDEVEAALDDANLGRLLQVFEQLRASSQLIVITHQKRTMEIADALYGVSMRQDGVSAVVGQRIARDDDAA